MLRLAAILYSALTAAAVLWCWLAGIFPWPLYDPRVSTPGRLCLGVLTGITLALVVVALSRLLVTRLSGFRRLHRFFREALGPMERREVLALALLSSVGEELFFRGAMQQQLGLAIATLVFAGLHFPSRPLLWPWTVMAGALGLAFGYLTRYTGSVAGATVAHLLINALNLDHISRWRPPVHSAEENLPAAEQTSSMGHHGHQQSLDHHHRDAPAAPCAGTGRGAEPQ